MVESSTRTDVQLSQFYAWPSSLTFRLNMLIGPSGTTAGEDGTSVSLTSAQDRRILRLIRKDADVVLLGAESVRKEGWFFPPTGRLIVLSKTGNLPLETCPHPERLFIAPSLSSALHNLRENENKILCEGGLATAELVHQHVCFDEIALTFRNEDSTAPDFIDFSEYQLLSELTEKSSEMTFRFWRRAAKPH